MPLWMPTRWCEYRAIRREAIKLLRWYGAREGVWGSLVMAEYANCYMELEEEGIENDPMPKNTRATLKDIMVDPAERWLWMKYTCDDTESGETDRETTVK